MEFQLATLETLAELVEQGETNPRNYAMLFDRVATNRGEKQRYGSQGMCTGPGTWEPLPVAEPEGVEERRQARGVETMEEYKTRFTEICP